MANFPGALPSIPTSTTNDHLNDMATLGHVALHNLVAGEILAVATKVGIGSSTPSNGTYLAGTGAGTSAWSSLNKSAVGLGLVDNTADADKPVSTATQTALNLKANLASPVFTGTPTIPSFASSQHDHSNAANGGQLSSTGLNFGGAGAGIWWEEIGRTTLTGVADTITVSSIPARTYLKVIIGIVNSGAIANESITFNNDTGTNYAFRYNSSAAFGSVASATSITNFPASSGPFMAEGIIYNVATSPKIVHFKGVIGNNAAATVPDYVDFWAKWVNTSVQINRIDCINAGAGDFAAGSEIIVLGHN
jgi:hypothetical protein